MDERSELERSKWPLRGEPLSGAEDMTDGSTIPSILPRSVSSMNWCSCSALGREESEERLEGFGLRNLFLMEDCELEEAPERAVDVLAVENECEVGSGGTTSSEGGTSDRIRLRERFLKISGNIPLDFRGS